MMPVLMVRASAWLLQAGATLPDTIVTRQIVARGWFDQLTHVASGILTLLLLALVLLVFPAAWYVRNRFRQLAVVLDGLRHDVAPVLERTRGVMLNAEQISQTVREDVERLSETVEQFDAQLREIADIAGARVRDFDALLGAVQEEAEDLFLSTASAARGLRAGVRAIRRRRSRDEAPPALDEPDDAPDADAPDDPADSAPLSRAPRLRRHRRRGT
ncbi:MAG: hypothetical protein ACYCVL_13075 [Gemmatimonadaceae bacterium]